MACQLPLAFPNLPVDMRLSPAGGCPRALQRCLAPVEAVHGGRHNDARALDGLGRTLPRVRCLDAKFIGNLIELLLMLIGQPVPLVSLVFALIGQPFALVGVVFALVGQPLTLVGQSFVLRGLTLAPVRDGGTCLR